MKFSVAVTVYGNNEQRNRAEQSRGEIDGGGIERKNKEKGLKNGRTRSGARLLRRGWLSSFEKSALPLAAGKINRR